MRRLTLRDFRCYEHARVELGAGLTVLSGPNGSGKTNLLEGLYFGCTGRSCRTSNERESVRFGAGVARVEVEVEGEDGPHQLAVGFQPGEAKRCTVDGAAVERLSESPARPLVAVFLPDRLELVSGGPALRRAHLDQVVGGLWPGRVSTRRSYGQALAQRNALLARARSGSGSTAALLAWDHEVARHGIALMVDRAAAVELVAERFVQGAAELGLPAPAELSYRPRSRARTAEELAGELAERLAGDLERGFTGHGPHRDELAMLHDGRELRAYGSRGQQRLALLALLLGERAAIAALRNAPPLMLLDDVMSELDEARRERLVAVLRRGGQSVLTTTELAHVPGAHGADVARLTVREGQVEAEALVA